MNNKVVRTIFLLLEKNGIITDFTPAITGQKRIG